ncbi:hypothetical protein EGI22_17890 [Lacihabitans sp. LS3-19]|uniref:hypothetical protein n=1 Tax=Lacihabitans sp. LS3-19 TaxID=2487335 RepID=UPI0020CDF578|nr:hypothetical protein [Lacihabitans sp. LS3-19]MCP9769780.1 hypothetical protein [Lacihabitans sp. LS3-19]
MTKIILKEDIGKIKLKALMDFLKKEDIEAKIEVDSTKIQKIKSKDGFPITIGLWNDYEIDGSTLRKKAWNLKL